MSASSGFARYSENFFRLRWVTYSRGQHRGVLCAPAGPGLPDCQLMIVEFDDQGLLFVESLMDQVETELDKLRDRNPVVVLFTHGWRHNAAAADQNLEDFRRLIIDVHGQTAGTGRPLLGIFLAWRGLKFRGNSIVEGSTFWNRRDAAGRVAVGTARELLGRLKSFRNGPPGTDSLPRATLVIVGHSFGGLIVYTAIAQSLIEAAAASDEYAVPSFGDLVLLVNPAFSAISYLPLHRITSRGSYNAAQLPVFVSVTAENDLATKVLYPLGTYPKLLAQAWVGRRERQAIFHTMGHLAWLRTHRITLPPPSATTQATPNMPAGRAAGASGSTPEGKRTLEYLSGASPEATPSSVPGPGNTQPGLQAMFGGVLVSRVPGRNPSPFWVASATRNVVDGHNGIFRPEFIGFVRELVTAIIAAPSPLVEARRRRGPEQGR